MGFLKRLFTGSLKLGYTFKVTSADPLDDRTVVSSKDHLYDVNYWLDFEDGKTRLYPGLVVSVVNSKKQYMFVGSRTDTALTESKWVEVPNGTDITALRNELLTKINTIANAQGAAFVYKGDIASENALYSLNNADVKAGHIYYSVGDETHFISVGHLTKIVDPTNDSVDLSAIENKKFVNKIIPIPYDNVEDQVGSWLTDSACIGTYPVKLLESSVTKNMPVYIVADKDDDNKFYYITNDNGVAVYLETTPNNFVQSAPEEFKYEYRTKYIYTWDPFGSKFTLEWS